MYSMSTVNSFFILDKRRFKRNNEQQIFFSNIGQHQNWQSDAAYTNGGIRKIC